MYLTDANYYASSAKQTLATVLPGGSARHVLLTTTSASIGLASLSPDGEQLAYFRGTRSTAKVDVMTLSTKKVTSVLKLRGTSAFLDGLAWTPDGHDLIVSTNEAPGASTTHAEAALWRVPAAGGSGHRLTAYVDTGSPAVAADGAIVYVESATFSSETLKKSSLWITDADGSHPKQLLASGHFVDSPSVSPNGHEIIFEAVTSQTTSHLQSMTIGVPGTKTLTPPAKGRSDLQPSWSPDGRDIVFLSSRAGRHEGDASQQLLDAYLMTATGTDVRKEIAFQGDTASVSLVSWGA